MSKQQHHQPIPILEQESRIRTLCERLITSQHITYNSALREQQQSSSSRPTSARSHSSSYRNQRREEDEHGDLKEEEDEEDGVKVETPRQPQRVGGGIRPRSAAAAASEATLATLTEGEIIASLPLPRMRLVGRYPPLVSLMSATTTITTTVLEHGEEEDEVDNDVEVYSPATFVGRTGQLLTSLALQRREGRLATPLLSSPSSASRRKQQQQQQAQFYRDNTHAFGNDNEVGPRKGIAIVTGAATSREVRLWCADAVPPPPVAAATPPEAATASTPTPRHDHQQEYTVDDDGGGGGIRGVGGHSSNNISTGSVTMGGVLQPHNPTSPQLISPQPSSSASSVSLLPPSHPPNNAINVLTREHMNNNSDSTGNHQLRVASSVLPLSPTSGGDSGGGSYDGSSGGHRNNAEGVVVDEDMGGIPQQHNNNHNAAAAAADDGGDVELISVQSGAEGRDEGAGSGGSSTTGAAVAVQLSSPSPQLVSYDNGNNEGDDEEGGFAMNVVEIYVPRPLPTTTPSFPSRRRAVIGAVVNIVALLAYGILFAPLSSFASAIMCLVPALLSLATMIGVWSDTSIVRESSLFYFTSKLLAAQRDSNLRNPSGQAAITDAVREEIKAIARQVTEQLVIHPHFGLEEEVVLLFMRMWQRRMPGLALGAWATPGSTHFCGTPTQLIRLPTTIFSVSNLGNANAVMAVITSVMSIYFFIAALMLILNNPPQPGLPFYDYHNDARPTGGGASSIFTNGADFPWVTPNNTDVLTMIHRCVLLILPPLCIILLGMESRALSVLSGEAVNAQVLRNQHLLRALLGAVEEAREDDALGVTSGGVGAAAAAQRRRQQLQQRGGGVLHDDVDDDDDGVLSSVSENDLEEDTTSSSSSSHYDNAGNSTIQRRHPREPSNTPSSSSSSDNDGHPNTNTAITAINATTTTTYTPLTDIPTLIPHFQQHGDRGEQRDNNNGNDMTMGSMGGGGEYDDESGSIAFFAFDGIVFGRPLRSRLGSPSNTHGERGVGGMNENNNNNIDAGGGGGFVLNSNTSIIDAHLHPDNHLISPAARQRMIRKREQRRQDLENREREGGGGGSPAGRRSASRRSIVASSWMGNRNNRGNSSSSGNGRGWVPTSEGATVPPPPIHPYDRILHRIAFGGAVPLAQDLEEEMEEMFSKVEEEEKWGGGHRSTSSLADESNGGAIRHRRRDREGGRVRHRPASATAALRKVYGGGKGRYVYD